MNEKDFSPQCFKIYFERNDVDLNKLIGKLNDFASILLNKKDFFVFLNYGVQKNKIKKIMSSCGVDEAFYENISAEKIENEADGRIKSWYKENYESEFLEYVQDTKKEQLIKIIKNVDTLQKYLEKKEKEGG